MSIFGSPVFDGVGGFNSGSYISDSLNVASGSLIVVCVVATIASFPVSVADNAGNSYSSLSAQNDGTTDYQWWYCLSASANSGTIITATFSGTSAGFGSLSTWVVPITGGTPAFDVASTIEVMSGSGNQLTNTFDTAGSDEIGFCTLFDRNGIAGINPWTAVSPASLDNGNYASSRSAADHITWSSPQTNTTIGLANSGTPIGGILAIAFQAGGGSGGAIACNMTGLGAVSASTGAFNLAAAMTGHGTVAGALFGKGALAAVVAGHGAVVAGGLGLSLIEDSMGGTSAVAADLGGIGVLVSAMLGHGILHGTLSTPYALNSNMLGRGSVVAFPTLPPSKTYLPPNNPMGRQSPPYVLKDFGVSLQAPAYLSTSSNALQLFHQTSYVPRVNAGSVLPPTWSTPGTPDNFNYQGRVQAPGELLVAPGNGSLSWKIYKVVAQGMIFTPSSAVNPSFNFVLNQNYFAFDQSQVSDNLFVMAQSIPLTPGTMVGFTLFDTLSGNGPGNGALGSGGVLWVGGTQYFGNGFSNRLVGREPQIQLSLGLQFNGTISDGEQFQAFLSQFQMFNQRF